jgi:hypothetical protein
MMGTGLAIGMGSGLACGMSVGFAAGKKSAERSLRRNLPRVLTDRGLILQDREGKKVDPDRVIREVLGPEDVYLERRLLVASLILGVLLLMGLIAFLLLC